MLFKKEGFPEENELVICTVSKVHFNSVFANLDQYGKQGMIHISEVSPGRIRNIRDYVKEGKVIVCKVLRINEEKGHIDLSLRRVSDGQRRDKVDEIKQEQKAEKVLEFIAKNLKKETTALYQEIFPKIAKKYEMLHQAFNAVVEEDLSLESLGIEKKGAQILEKEIKQRIKPSEVQITGNLVLKSYEPNGVEIIKDAIKKSLSVSKQVSIGYSGGGSYSVSVTARDYPEAEAIIKDASNKAIEYAEAHNSEGSFVREEQ